MRRILIYISILLGLLASCQQPEMEIYDPAQDVCGEDEVVVSFSVSLPDDGIATKARGDEPSVDITSLHLLIFDENGYYLETCPAEFTSSAGSHGSHSNERNFKVTLKKTEKERIIHFIANCPVDQIFYGHESEVIANMYVTKGDLNETAYWYRTEVWYILTGTDGKLLPEVATRFNCVPLLRNYSSITVNNEANDFIMESFAIYNTIDIGTVAPYNPSSHGFQLFTDGQGALLTYDELGAANYEGHVLSMAKLNTILNDRDFVAPGENVYMYERKISVRPGDESKWGESPAHIIIKGRYAGSATSSYYKVDMVKNVNGTNVYYNILRNFRYTFVVNSVAGPGYTSYEEAMANPAGNNLSGATDTQGFTNISDGLGRVFVSYTDTTLISSGDITLKYKYIPSVNEYNKVANERVNINSILDGSGSVLKGIKGDVNLNAGDGWAEVTFSVQDPGAVTHLQEVVLNVLDNPNLNKTIRYRLQKPLDMQVNCYPNRVAKMAGRSVNVAISIPVYLTEDMFPLDLAIEVDALTLAPDVVKPDNVMPVNPAMSIIPGKEDKKSYHFVKTIVTYDEYLALPIYEGVKQISTYWLTTKAESASDVYVYNKYFSRENAHDRFENTNGFTLLNFPDGVMAGVGESTLFEFNMNTTDEIRVILTGLVNEAGESEFTYKPQQPGRQSLNLKTAQESGTVKVRLESEAYEPAELDAVQNSKLEIPELIITFRWTGSGAQNQNSVTPKLSVSDGSISYGNITRNRTQTGNGNNRIYTYTITLRNVVIDGASNSSMVTVSYTYSNRTYSASVTVGDLRTNTGITLEQQ